MKFLKNRHTFILESNQNIDWIKVEEFIKKLKHDDQFYDQSPNFHGYININPKDTVPGIYQINMEEFLKAFNDKTQSDKFDDLMDRYGMYVQTYDGDEELIIAELEDIYKYEDPIKFLKERGCTEKDGEWSCPGIINISNNRSPLVKDGKLIIQFDKVEIFSAENCGLTTLEGCPKRFQEMYIGGNLFSKHEFEFYMRKRGYKNLWLDLLKFMIDEKKDINDVKGWPDGFLNDDLIRSISGIAKYNL